MQEFWEEKSDQLREECGIFGVRLNTCLLYTSYLRNTFASLLITGPFSILLGFEGGMMALNDRLKLRSMVVAEKGEMFYAASEECAIRILEPNPDRLYAPRGGEPVIVTLNGGAR